nr:hypothetical protein Iba_chr12bCG18110 [Ipomoea batatas]GMD82710.1 hypothetical protein Iba_scaffold349355CG0010 [Ipomoea batatas]
MDKNDRRGRERRRQQPLVTSGGVDRQAAKVDVVWFRFPSKSNDNRRPSSCRRHHMKKTGGEHSIIETPPLKVSTEEHHRRCRRMDCCGLERWSTVTVAVVSAVVAAAMQGAGSGIAVVAAAV